MPHHLVSTVGTGSDGAFTTVTGDGESLGKIAAFVVSVGLVFESIPPITPIVPVMIEIYAVSRT